MTLQIASILIVDDDELNCELLKRRLEVDDHHITTVTTGTEALETLHKKKFDLVLLDITLPDINGVEVLKTIKKDPELDSTQVMMFTANGDREMVLRCIDAGAIDYLTKPFSLLLVKLRVWRSLKNASIQTKENDPVDSKVLLIDDQELNRDVLAHRLTKCGYHISKATNGYEALDILQKEKFDLILLDIMMPDISGIEVLKKIRQINEHKITPVIMITAMDDIETVNECMEAGADDYTTKPYNTALLKLRISSCLQSRNIYTDK